MPYIKQEFRDKIDPLLPNLTETIRSLDKETGKGDGIVNYTLTRLILQTMRPDDGWNYASLMKVIGTLECIKQEIFIVLINTYEDIASKKNGKIEELQGELENVLEEFYEADYEKRRQENEQCDEELIKGMDCD